MSKPQIPKLCAALMAAVFATSALAGPPGRGERWDGRADRGHAVAHDRANNHRERIGNGRILGLGLLAGTALLLAAAHNRNVAYAPAVSVYGPAPVLASPPVVVYSSAPARYATTTAPAWSYAETASHWWYYCAQPAGYYPYVSQCRTGWTRVSPLPPG